MTGEEQKIEEEKIEEQKIPYEIYKLTLEHYIVGSNGERYRIEEPLVVKMAIDTSTPSPVYLNRMIDMMRNEILKL